jgi:hypothetical protein
MEGTLSRTSCNSQGYESGQHTLNTVFDIRIVILFSVTLPDEFLYLVLAVLSKTQLMFTTSLGAFMRCCCVPNQDFTLQAIYIIRTHQIMDVQNVGIIGILAAIKYYWSNCAKL